MSAESPSFRELFDEIGEYRGHALFANVLAPWIDNARRAVSDCARFKSPIQLDRQDNDARLAMWNLYALSRVNDRLLVPFQPSDQPTHPEQQLRLQEYQEFFTRIGFTTFDSEHFTPFRHEIVQVHPADNDDEPIGSLKTYWPGLMFGNMIFSRSGVEVRGGSRHVVKEVAESSTLYFTYHRRRRKTEDLSLGWGHNSQWRTNFRRDYECDGKRIYNLDGRKLLGASPPSDGDDDLTLPERIELCRHRCFVVTAKPDADRYPYNDRFEESTSCAE